MNFSVPERIQLLSALPQQGDILTLRTARRLREALSFSDQELTEYEILQEVNPAGGLSFRWNKTTAKPKEIEIGTVAREMIIVAALKKLNDLAQ